MTSTKRPWIPALLMILLLLPLTVFGEGLIIGATDTPPLDTQGYTRDEVLQFMRDGAAPNFTLQDVEGASLTLSDLRGRVVVLLFWVSWDQGSLDSLAQLQALHASHPDLAVLSINSLPTESNQAPWTADAQAEHLRWVQGYFAENNYQFAVLLDPAGEVERMHAYQGGGLPMTFFIDRDGVLRIPWQGKLSPETVGTLLSMMYALDQ